MHENTGSRIGRYSIVKRLGGGAFAQVYLAEAEGRGGFVRSYAIKVLKTQLAADEKYVAEFLSEARLGGLLVHPHIVPTLEVSQPGEIPYLVMEFVDGVTLRQLLEELKKQQGPLPLPTVFDIAITICKALKYAHTAKNRAGRPLNLIHRDLKPENILIDIYGTLKIADFGIAKAEGSEQTSYGIAVGTLAYMSPEQAQRGIEGEIRQTLDARSDLFSMGAIIYEMVVGDRLYHGDLRGLMGLIRVGDANLNDRLHLLAPHGLGIKEFLQKLLAKDRDKRHIDAAEVERDLVLIRQRMTESPATLADIVTTLRTAPGQVIPIISTAPPLRPTDKTTSEIFRQPRFIVAGVAVLLLSGLLTYQMCPSPNLDPTPGPKTPTPVPPQIVTPTPKPPQSPTPRPPSEPTLKPKPSPMPPVRRTPGPVKPTPAPPVVTYGFIGRIKSRPSAEVVLDKDRNLGWTPVTGPSIKVKTGRHTLTLTPENNEDYETKTLTIEIKEGETYQSPLIELERKK